MIPLVINITNIERDITHALLSIYRTSDCAQERLLLMFFLIRESCDFKKARVVIIYDELRNDLWETGWLIVYYSIKFTPLTEVEWLSL